MKYAASVLVFAGLLLLVRLSSYAQDWSKYQITTHKITDQIYMLEGAGGNIGLFIGSEGNILIDDQFAPMAEKVKSAVRKISKNDIKYVINTHWHGDHVGGNENFALTGSVIVAHDNVRKRMTAGQLIEFTGKTVEAAKMTALPVVTFDKSMQFHTDGETIHIFHVLNGHTDGDALIYFKNNNVIHMGDTYFAGQYPFVDWSSGGSVDGLLSTLNKAILLVNNQTIIIPGHGPISTNADLIAYRNNIQESRDIILEQINLGKTMDEFLATDLLKEKDDKWGQGWIDRADWVRILYKLYE